MNCTTSNSLSLKWNNERLESFAPKRGLRQGDPMSPYLFVLYMEKLALIIQEKIEDKKWLPVKVSRIGPAISHLFFVDDCLIFTHAKSSQVKLVEEALKHFCTTSGLKVNIQKTKFHASKNVPRTKVSKFASIYGFSHTYNLGKYLGFPILSGRVGKRDFSYILDRINGRLVGWNAKTLNRERRVTLAKSVITSIPIYSMQNIWIPGGVCNHIDDTVRGFIWGGHHNHWVKWNSITQPKSEGGLGIRMARETNIALLGKHAWSLLHNSHKLWVNMLSLSWR